MSVKDDFTDLVDGGGIRLTTIIHLVCYAVLLIVLALISHYAFQEAVGRAKAEATSQAEQRVRETADANIASREAAYKETIAALQREAANIRTQKQAVQIVTKYVPTAAPAAEVTRKDLTPEMAAKLPDSPGYTVRTAEQEIAVATALNKCQQDKSGLTKCESDKVDLTAKLDSMTRERDTWQAAAKGGTKWQRFGRTMKLIGCSGAGALVGGMSNKPKVGAPAGAVSGVILCSLF